eukprot:2942365-Prymnesium_polylepis.1
MRHASCAVRHAPCATPYETHEYLRAGADQAGAQGRVPSQMYTSLAVAQEAPISLRGLRARQV